MKKEEKIRIKIEIENFILSLLFLTCVTNVKIPIDYLRILKKKKKSKMNEQALCNLNRFHALKSNII